MTNKKAALVTSQRDRGLSAAIEEVHIFGMTAIFRL